MASRVVDGEAVLVKMPEGILHVLTPSATRMWVRADGTRSGRDLAEGLDPPAADAFLVRMTELGMLERTPAPLAEARASPQEVELAPSTEAPEIRVSEPVETLAGLSCTQLSIACGVVDAP